MGIASLVFVALLAVAIAFLLWTFGATWPLRSRDLLVRSISGHPGQATLPPRWMLLGFSILALAAGIVALSLADHDSGGVWLSVVGAALGALFIARGIAGFTPGWRRANPGEPFAAIDRKVYSPVSLGIGICFLALVMMRLL